MQTANAFWKITIGRLGKPCEFLTGKERDSESNNDYFGARYYFAGNARWLSVDPEKVPTDPQQLNGYNYVRNDPVNFVDRDGRNLGMINEGGGECSPGDPFCGGGGYAYWYAGAEGSGKWWSYFGGNPGTTSPTPQPGGGGGFNYGLSLTEAIDTALIALMNPDCASLFGVPANDSITATPSSALEGLRKGTAGHIFFSDLGPKDASGRVVGAFTRPGNPLDPNNGVWWTDWAYIYISNNADAEWSKRSKYDRAETLLHELGHLLRAFGYVLNPSVFVDNQFQDVDYPESNFDRNYRNQELINRRCIRPLTLTPRRKGSGRTP